MAGPFPVADAPGMATNEGQRWLASGSGNWNLLVGVAEDTDSCQEMEQNPGKKLYF